VHPSARDQFSGRLQAVLEAAGLSQAALARKLRAAGFERVGEPRVSEWCNGRALPRDEAVVLAIEALAATAGAAIPAGELVALYWSARGEPRPGQAAVPVPRELPLRLVDFTGRQAELARLRALLDEAEAGRAVVISAIDGLGGVGKSSLAIEAGWRLAGRFPDGQLYVDLQGSTVGLRPLTALEALGRLLRSLGADPRQLPTDLEEAAGRLRSLTAGRRLLFLLDNARDAAQIRPLLPGDPSCVVLITSRDTLAYLDGVARLPLDVLAEAEALELLGRLAGPRLGTRVGWTLGQYADQLADEHHRLDHLRFGDREVRGTFAVSYQALAAEDPDAARAFRLLSLVDGPDFPLAAAAVLLDQPAEAAAAVLERLVDASLLGSPEPGRYRFHDLVRAYAREQTGARRPGQGAAATAGEHEGVEAVGRLLRWYLATARRAALLVQPVDLEPLTPEEAALALPLDHREAALGWFEAERSNLLAAVGQAARERAWARLCIALACTLPPLVRSSGPGEEWERSYRVALRVAQELQAKPAEAQLNVELSIIRALAGDDQASLRHTEDALAAYRMAGDRAGEARSLNNLGALYHELGRLPEAMGSYERALELARRVGHRRYQAYALANLAAMRRDLGRLGEAVDLDLAAIALFGDIGDRHGQADATDDLALAHRAAGRHDEALAAHRAALGIVRDLADRPREGRILRELATTLLQAGDAPQAVTVLQQSLAVLAQARDRYGEAHARRQLGAALQVLGNPEHAARCWREALSIFTELGTPEANEVRLELAGLPPG
jgi:tetratricopeptide (TPR) repeat protein/transcriptional regulator with XRE-family HTH domain